MSLKFFGELDELQKKLESEGITEKLEEKPNNCYRLKRKDGAGLNWSSSKGTLWFDGPSPFKEKLEEAVASAVSGETGTVVSPQGGETTVFVVHGHDTESREQLELVLHKLGLDPYVLQNTDGAGKTIIENLENMIGKNATSSFGIVLLTPDDVGYARVAGPETSNPRARQNVVLEMGMLLASLTRDRVAILQKGFVEAPSDVQGVVYLPFNDHVKEVAAKLASRLQDAGFDIPPHKIASAAS